MNYQFIRDLEGSPIAQFDMGSETFSRWFSEELGSDENKIAVVFEIIQKLQSEQIKEYVLQGSEFNLSLDQDEVEIRSKTLDVEAPVNLPEGTELYDQESIAGCGLEDFSHVLASWNDFVFGK